MHFLPLVVLQVTKYGAAPGCGNFAVGRTSRLFRINHIFSFAQRHFNSSQYLIVECVVFDAHAKGKLENSDFDCATKRSNEFFCRFSSRSNVCYGGISCAKQLPCSRLRITGEPRQLKFLFFIHTHELRFSFQISYTRLLWRIYRARPYHLLPRKNEVILLRAFLKDTTTELAGFPPDYFFLAKQQSC